MVKLLLNKGDYSREGVAAGIPILANKQGRCHNSVCLGFFQQFYPQKTVPNRATSDKMPKLYFLRSKIPTQEKRFSSTYSESSFGKSSGCT
jgi:hypothetical protein